jgi:hypothetical protein
VCDLSAARSERLHEFRGARPIDGVCCDRGNVAFPVCVLVCKASPHGATLIARPAPPPGQWSRQRAYANQSQKSLSLSTRHAVRRHARFFVYRRASQTSSSAPSALHVMRLGTSHRSPSSARVSSQSTL